MSTAVLILADRDLRGFQNALFSWHSVKGVDEVKFVVALQPSDVQQHMREEFEEFVHHRGLTRTELLELTGPLAYEDQLQLMLAKLFDEGFDSVWECAENEIVPEDVLEN